MAVTIVGTAGTVDTASATVDTYTMPAGIAAGDGALLFMTYASGAITQTLTDNGLSSPFVAVAPIATFVGHQSQVFAAGNLTTADAGKVITATQSTTVRVAGVLVVYRGVSRTALVNAFASKTSTAASASPLTPTVTTTAAGCVEVSFIGMTRGSSTPQIATITPPTGSVVGATSYSPAAGAAVTTAATAAFEGHNFTVAVNGATLGGDTYTTDQSAVYSAWTLALAPGTASSADAGADQTIPAGQTVVLSGTDSAAAGTTITARAWTALTYPGTTAPTLTGATTATATFTAVAGEYTFRYRITDSTGATNDSTVTVYATTVDARPSATPSAGIWTPFGGPTTIHAALADELDTTGAQAVNPSGASFTLDLPPAPVGAKTIDYRVQVDPATGGNGTWLVEYLAPGVVASKTTTSSTTGVVAGQLVLTDTQNALVTDPLNHQLRFTGTVG